MLMDLGPQASMRQNDLFATPADSEKSTKLMATMDALNARFGRGSTRLAAEGVEQDQKMKRGRMSPCYTTRWEDLPIVA